METLTRKYRGETRVFTVYEAAECPVAVPWRESAPGDWALTDDGYAVECLSMTAMGDTDMLVFSIARAIRRQKRPLLWQERRETRDFLGFRAGSWREREAGRKRTKRVVQMYVKMSISGSIDWDTLGKAYRPDQKKPAATVKRLFKTEEVKNMVSKELDEVFTKNGITREFVLEKLKKAVSLAETAEDSKSLLKAVEIMSEMLDMMPKKASVSVGYMANLGPVDQSDMDHIAAMREPTALPEKPPEGAYENAELLAGEDNA